MREKDNRRARTAQIIQAIRKRRAARKERGRITKVRGDLLEQVKEKMVMRIYGVSHDRAKEIIAGRMAERAALEAENRATPPKRARTCRRVYSSAGEWIPMDDIIGMEVGESDD